MSSLFRLFRVFHPCRSAAAAPPPINSTSSPENAAGVRIRSAAARKNLSRRRRIQILRARRDKNLGLPERLMAIVAFVIY